MADMALYIADTKVYTELSLAQSNALLLNPLALMNSIFGIVNNIPSVPVVYYLISHAPK